jgi:N-acetyl sugar amidotransferase
MRICKRCVLDGKVPEIEFNSDGECNYCELHDRLSEAFPNDVRGKEILEEMFTRFKKQGEGKEYDCVVGVSGGVDSTYLIHLAKSYGLRPLAVHVDNGWNSEISVSNIKNSIEKLNVDLITYVIDWNEMKDVLKSFVKASYAWADGPTDIALVSALYRIAKENGVKNILVGNNFRTEGRQPTEWTHIDARVINHIHKRFGSIKKLKSFPNLSILDLFMYEFLYSIKMVKPLYFLDYDKGKAKELVTKDYGWKDYGGHHHESIFTRFIIGYWLPQKFGIDKRKITFSAQIRTGLRDREQALEELKELPYDENKMNQDKEYVIKKLGFSEEEFKTILKLPNTTYKDYPSYNSFFNFIGKYLKFIYKIFGVKPMMAFDLPSYEEKKSMVTERYRLKKIASLVKDCKEVLDVGCSASPNLYLKNKKVIGLDLNEKVNMSSNYYKIVKGNVFDLPKPFTEESFEAITAGEILEHLDSPMLFLKNCYKTLKPGGILVFSTPNPNSFFERILTLNLSRKFFYNPEHISLYPQRWLIRMGELNGFKNIKILSGGLTIPILSKNIPFPRPWAEYTIVYAEK